MNGVSSRHAVTVELQGHLIDSLTLGKVIDRLQQLGGDYRLNDIEIGSRKKDISSVNLTVMAADEQLLQQLIEEIKPYGAVISDQQEVRLETVGRLSEDVYTLQAPRRVHLQGQWIDIANSEQMVIRVNPQAKTAEMVNLRDLKPGDQVVAGTSGVQW